MRPPIVSLACAFVLAACGAQPLPDARTTVISLQKIDCAECGHEIVSDLRRRPGVYDARFDRRRAEISVTASSAFDVYSTVKQLAANEGYEALLGGGKGLYLDFAKFPEGADVATIARDGQDVPRLEEHLVRGKVTVVDFSAIWCEPCRKVDEHMAGVLSRRGDVAYRKLDIGDWDTPLAQRYLRAVPQLPYVIVYGADGQQVEAISGLATARLDAAIERAARASASAPAQPAQ
ncbi:MAG TPA: thioredoxin family protein [Candidatus Nanopelagicales bacterium]|nr:thioredoxin family protein [Candidatus Nanopelagicales bacterium]